MRRYGAYYEQSRNHLSLNKDAPIPRPIAAPTAGPVVAIPQVGGPSPLRAARGLSGVAGSSTHDDAAQLSDSEHRAWICSTG